VLLATLPAKQREEPEVLLLSTNTQFFVGFKAKPYGWFIGRLTLGKVKTPSTLGFGLVFVGEGLSIT